MRAVRRVLVVLLSAPLPVAMTALADEPHTRVVLVPGAGSAPSARTGAATTARPDAAPAPPLFAADPPPLVARPQWIWELKWSKGDVYLLAVRPWDPGAPRKTPRVVGRFALELSDGPAVVERVRFDFPALGMPDTDGGHFAPPSLQAHMTTRVGVIFPQVSRGTKLDLVDRATGERWALPWPPGAPGGGGGDGDGGGAGGGDGG